MSEFIFVFANLVQLIQDLLLCDSHPKQREAKIEHEVKRGIHEPNKQDPIHVCQSSDLSSPLLLTFSGRHHKGSHKILSDTYGICILQDFEVITPNLLARTIETVEGGGLSIYWVNKLTDPAGCSYAVPDFCPRPSRRTIQRTVYTLGSCDDCLVLDDELNVLPISREKDIKPLEDKPGKTKEQSEPIGLKETLLEPKPIGELIKLAETLDQAQAILTFVDAISKKTLSSTVTLTATRGRGKYAALRLAIAAALAHGYSEHLCYEPRPQELEDPFRVHIQGHGCFGVRGISGLRHRAEH